MTFDEILDVIVVPRENGSSALAQVAAYLEQTARATGAAVSVHEFVCRPYAARIAGIVALALALIYFALMWRRRYAWALVVAIVLPIYLQCEASQWFPLLSRIGEVAERNIVLSFPVTQPQRTVILGAHYDTKTDLLDHYQRAPIQFAIAPMLIVTLLLALTGWRRQRYGRGEGNVRAGAIVVPVYFIGFLLAMSGGALVHARSPGALDDGAAVATLLRLADLLGAGAPKLTATDVQIVLFAGEEVNLQGSARYVADRGGATAERPTYFINIEGWGFGRQLSYFTGDRSPLRRRDASGPLVRTLDRAYRRITRGPGLIPDVQPVTSDAGSFLAAGIPSVTLGSHHNGEHRVRFLHSATDTRDRIVPNSLEPALSFLQAALAEIDGSGVRENGT